MIWRNDGQLWAKQCCIVLFIDTFKGVLILSDRKISCDRGEHFSLLSFCGGSLINARRNWRYTWNYSYNRSEPKCYCIISVRPPQAAANAPVRWKLALAVIVFMCFDKKRNTKKKNTHKKESNFPIHLNYPPPFVHLMLLLLGYCAALGHFMVRSHWSVSWLRSQRQRQIFDAASHLSQPRLSSLLLL